MGMFHDGDLQSGISRAISEAKLVAVLIRQDDDDWCQVWEEQWLGGEDARLGDEIGQKAVLLRISFGSQAAGFLSAFCPIEKAPTLVVIQNGQVLEKLQAGISHQEFEGRLRKAVGLPPPAHAEGTESRAPAALSVHRSETPSPATVIDASQRAATLHPAAEIPSPTQTSDSVRTLLQERSMRLEAERLRREAQEKQERISRAKARREEAGAAAGAPSKPDKGKGRAHDPLDAKEDTRTKARADWIKQQAERKEEAKRERERILLQIESDRQERRNREQRDRAARMDAEPLPDSSAAAVRRAAGDTGMGNCALHIRLFDGSSIKGRFAPDSTLATGVRTWITEASPPGGADIPYNFRQILAPQPSRSIGVTEEQQTLAELGFLPNATLVLVPVTGYTEAYTPKGVFSSGYLASGLNLINWGFSLPFTALDYLCGGGSSVNATEPRSSGLYMGGTADEQEPSNVAGSRMAGADSATAEVGGAGRPGVLRVQTLADKRKEEAERGRTEFYNGNSLGFEPRREDDGRSQPDG